MEISNEHKTEPKEFDWRVLVQELLTPRIDGATSDGIQATIAIIWIVTLAVVAIFWFVNNPFSNGGGSFFASIGIIIINLIINSALLLGAYISSCLLSKVWK